MHRFAFFVDGSNLFGSIKALGVAVDDYEKFYWYIFEQTVIAWRDTFISNSNPPAQLQRVYWYVVGDMDDWDLSSENARTALRGQFDGQRELKSLYCAKVGAGRPEIDQRQVQVEAWEACFADLERWYNGKRESLNGMKRFYHSLRSETDFIDVIECGRWKVNFMTKSVSEKGLDTRLAVDMLGLAVNYDVAVVVSGDADSIPSIEYMKRQGKHVAAVEFVRGYPPERCGRGFSSQMKLACDFVVRIYEMDLVPKGIAKRA